MKKSKINWGKIIENIVFIVSIAFLSWIAISYIDGIAHQYSGGTDAWWNFFVIFFNV